MKRDLASLPVEKGGLRMHELRALVGRPDPVIVEIGANVGQTTAEFLKAMPDARIYCFEPDPRAIALFKARIDSPNVTLFECAVGNHNGGTRFHQSSGKGKLAGWNQSGSIRAPKEHRKIWPNVVFETEIEVAIVRLDDWAKSEAIGEVDFVWADTQGAEVDLILGGMNFLGGCRYFYTEYGFKELYEGQIPLSGIDALLDRFSALRVFSMDALFENMTIKARSGGKTRSGEGGA